MCTFYFGKFSILSMRYILYNIAMYPNLFGINDFSYALLIVIGIIGSFISIVAYLKHKGYENSVILDVLACTCFTIAIGFVGSVLFQNAYNLIKDPSAFEFSLSMTFYGGLITGVIAFIVIFNLYVKKHSDIRIKEIAVVAPLCITVAHAFGRIGCFLAGSCYGKETDSWIGVDFPDLGKRIPTQLIEALFLFILTGVLIFIIFKTSFRYTLHIYMASYSIFRFIIEFFRGDEARGGTLFGLYPSQIVCVLIWIIFIPAYWALNKFVFCELKDEEK